MKQQASSLQIADRSSQEHLDRFVSARLVVDGSGRRKPLSTRRERQQLRIAWRPKLSAMVSLDTLAPPNRYAHVIQNHFIQRAIQQTLSFKMSGEQQQHQIVDSLVRNFQQARHQFKHTHIQLGVLMMAKRPAPRDHSQKHVSPPPPPTLVATDTRDGVLPIGTAARERRNNIGRRKSFAVEQLLGLEFQYSQSKYLKGKLLNIVADQLKLTKDQVKIWFQNRRAKENRYRRQMTKKVGNSLDESGFHRLDTMFPTSTLPANLVLPPAQQQLSASHSHLYYHLHKPIHGGLLLRDTCRLAGASSQNIDLAKQASSS